MYASEPFFNFEPRRPVVPSWFRGLAVPFLLLLALPLSLLVLALMLGLDVAARSLLRLFISRPEHQCARSRNGRPMARRS